MNQSAVAFRKRRVKMDKPHKGIQNAISHSEKCQTHDEVRSDVGACSMCTCGHYRGRPGPYELCACGHYYTSHGSLIRDSGDDICVHAQQKAKCSDSPSLN